MKKSLTILILFPLVFAQCTAFADGGSITNNRYTNSLIGGVGPTGATGPAGPAGPGFNSSYGKLYQSSHTSIIPSFADQWLPIPFDTFGPSSNMNGSTSSPATITILGSGVYQLNVSLYFASEDSNEGSYNQTTYSLGASINGGTVEACSAVYAGQAGNYSLNFCTLLEFSENDYIQFFISTSAVGGDASYDNVVTFINGNASLVQISN